MMSKTLRDMSIEEVRQFHLETMESYGDDSEAAEKARREVLRRRIRFDCLLLRPHARRDTEAGRDQWDAKVDRALMALGLVDDVGVDQ